MNTKAITLTCLALTLSLQSTALSLTPIPMMTVQGILFPDLRGHVRTLKGDLTDGNLLNFSADGTSMRETTPDGKEIRKCTLTRETGSMRCQLSNGESERWSYEKDRCTVLHEHRYPRGKTISNWIKCEQGKVRIIASGRVVDDQNPSTQKGDSSGMLKWPNYVMRRYPPVSEGPTSSRNVASIQIDEIFGQRADSARSMDQTMRIAYEFDQDKRETRRTEYTYLKNVQIIWQIRSDWKVNDGCATERHSVYSVMQKGAFRERAREVTRYRCDEHGNTVWSEYTRTGQNAGSGSYKNQISYHNP